MLSAQCLLSFYDFIRSRQHIRRNRQADLLRRFQIDHQLKLGRLLDEQVSRLGAFEDFVHVTAARAY